MSFQASNITHKLYCSCNIDILVSNAVNIGTYYKSAGSSHKYVKLGSSFLIYRLENTPLLSLLSRGIQQLMLHFLTLFLIWLHISEFFSEGR